MRDVKNFKTKIGDSEVEVIFSDLVKKADQSVLVKSGGTAVLSIVCMSEVDSNLDYFPLSIEYQEKFYSIGRILGGRFIRREGQPSLDAVVKGRIIDRTIRPFFPKHFKREVQITNIVLSLGEENTETLSILGTSIALSTSKIPWNGPISGVLLSRMGKSWEPFSHKHSNNHLLICGKGEKISMIEMEGDEIKENEILDASKKALDIIKQLEEFQNSIVGQIAIDKFSFEIKELSKNGVSLFEKEIQKDLKKELLSEESFKKTKLKWNEIVKNELEDESSLAEEYFMQKIKEIVREEVISNDKRIDGRGLNDLREIYTSVEKISDIIHGTGIFYRGDTHVLSALTLGSPADAILKNTIEEPESEKKFFLHYNFPPYTVGETGRFGGPKRRELGHGALAEKALLHVLPDEESFPYTIRLVAECFSSDGSTSMGAVCAGTLALLDGGVNIKNPVAGIAIGIMGEDKNYKILTDIKGIEDMCGFMDLKVAGTEAGITAMQMDVKNDGLTLDMLNESLIKARDARIKIIKKIENVIDKPRKSFAKNVPQIKIITIDPDLIGRVIGSGGKTIKEIKKDSEVNDISIEDDGKITISGKRESVLDAIGKIEMITKTFEVGEILQAEIKTLKNFGAFAEIAPGKDGMIHISEFSPKRIESTESVLKIGDKVPVMIKEIGKDGRIALSIKEADPKFFD